MSIITIRVNDKEKNILEQLSKLYGVGLSSVIKKVVFEKIEDDFDLELIKNYEQRNKKSDLNFKSLQTLSDEVGINFEEL